MTDNGLFDLIYHEHLSYLSLSPLETLLEAEGLRVFNIERTEVGASGPAMQAYVCHSDASYVADSAVSLLRDEETKRGIKSMRPYVPFRGLVTEIRQRTLNMIHQLNGEGYSIGGFGAPAKGNTLLNSVGLNRDHLSLIAENNPQKIGKVTPGSHIPIVDDETFLSSGVTHALLLSWNYADFFLEKSEFVRRGGKFIVPLPELWIAP